MSRSDSVARKLASQMWGRPESQFKLADGIWLFHTNSHGGIIVDTDVRPEILQVMEKTFVYRRSGADDGYSNEQHFVALEEDCDAPIAEWFYPDDIITAKLRKRFGGTECFSAWKQQRIEMIRASLSRWHPEVLQKYPNPGMK